MSAKPRIRMPAGARAGIGLLIMGGIIVGLGQYFDRGAWSLFGVATVASGFVLYMASSIMAKRAAGNR